MNLKHKHLAVIVVSALVATFVVLAGWYMLGARKAMAPVTEVATSTPATAEVTGPLHLVDHAAYYDIDLTYPASTPLAALSASANAAAVAQMKKFTDDTAAQFKIDGNFANLTSDDIKMQGLGERKYALTSEYKVYTGARTVSYVYQLYADTLGAHPNAYFRTFTYDTKTGQEVTLKDLFLPSIPYLQRVSGRARADLPAIIKKLSGGYEGDPDMLALGTKPEAENFQWFYIDGANLVFIFPPYAVGPYALGIVTDPIPLAQLGDSLVAEYR